jgi:uncharacterized OB-fold protein
MSMFPADMPRPQPDIDDQQFWANCAGERLCFQGCADCGALRHPPTPICWNCHSVAVKWVEAPEEASVYTFNVVYHPSHPAVTKVVPYIGAVVDFPTMPGVRVVTNIVDVDPATVSIGMSVKLVWDDIGDGMKIYRFKSAGV